MTRRSWLLGALAASLAGAAPRAGHPRLDAIRAKGRQAGMEGFDESESPHYLAIGDAPKRFREEALAVCEGVAADFFKYFDDKKFDLSWPVEKLVIVTLMGPKSYAKFEGGFLDEAVGGHYDLDANRLVMFDFRGPGANPKAAIAEQDNTLVLVHEATHQLTYNSGLLNLKSDVPLCISEGLATYGETWSPRHHSGFGAVNLRRRKGLEQGRQQGVAWIPIATLLADDKPLTDPKAQQVAYAESWLLINKLLKDPARLHGFRDYLQALKSQPDPTRRLELATAHLGDLGQLDKAVRTGR